MKPKNRNCLSREAGLAIEVHQDSDLILLKSIIEICKRCG